MWRCKGANKKVAHRATVTKKLVAQAEFRLTRATGSFEYCDVTRVNVKCVLTIHIIITYDILIQYRGVQRRALKKRIVWQMKRLKRTVKKWYVK